MKRQDSFDEAFVIKQLKHYLPSQAPLKDFVHHNPLHSFQQYSFKIGTQNAKRLMGQRTLLSMEEYQQLYKDGRISDKALDYTLQSHKGKGESKDWKQAMLSAENAYFISSKIGRLRNKIIAKSGINFDDWVLPKLFRLIGTYLDQGIGLEWFPTQKMSFLKSVQFIQRNSLYPLFKSERVIQLLNEKEPSLYHLLKILVGKEAYFEFYLFDQQFTHPGWSGLVSVLEDRPNLLYDKKVISLFDLIYVELLFEIDCLENQFGEGFKPLADYVVGKFESPIINIEEECSEHWEMLYHWQEAYEMETYDAVLAALAVPYRKEQETKVPKFQAYFCIDDREESLRRNLELLAPDCETFGSPAFYGVKAMFKSMKGKHLSQICPGPEPNHLIKEIPATEESHHWEILHLKPYQKKTLKHLLQLGKLFINPIAHSFKGVQADAAEHFDDTGKLILDHEDGLEEKGYQIGFTLDEKVTIVYNELKNTGLVEGFSPLIYFFGHGGSSTNNPYYAGYNCGACAGKPSSLNARVFATFANEPKVREALADKGVCVPATTQIVGGLHDTTKDLFIFYEIDKLSDENQRLHKENVAVFTKALHHNAKERARQFTNLAIKKVAANKVHKWVEKRSFALFEPRPELNHTNNALCIVGPRTLTQNVFLDQRAFLNSYAPELDSEGTILSAILNAATPVCGGINLEYFFSRMDNEQLGAGSKLSHNVLSLIAVANGVLGDLRTGLPSQMIDMHSPLRLMMVVEQKLNIVEKVLQENPSTFEWYKNDWMKLAVIDPESKEIFFLKEGVFQHYEPFTEQIPLIDKLESFIETSSDCMPIHNLSPETKWN